MDPRQKITINQLGDHEEYDRHALAQDVDFAAWDEYVGSGHFDPDDYGVVADQHRGYKRQNFWVMETAPGTVNWAATNDSLRNGRCYRGSRSHNSNSSLLVTAHVG